MAHKVGIEGAVLEQQNAYPVFHQCDKPHRAWAERVLQRADVFGVAREDIGFVDLLAAGLPD